MPVCRVNVLRYPLCVVHVAPVKFLQLVVVVVKFLVVPVDLCQQIQLIDPLVRMIHHQLLVRVRLIVVLRNIFLVQQQNLRRLLRLYMIHPPCECCLRK